MSHKHSIFSAAALAVLLLTSGAAIAQTGELRGNVQLVGADGKPAPLAGATVDVFRTDISGDYHTKTDKKGNWVFAGLPYVGTYIVSISAPGAQPNAKSGVKVSQETPVDVILQPGDGRRLTRDEATSVAGSGGSSSSGGKETAADKAKREEEIKKYEEEKKRIGNINEMLARTFKAGNDAITAKNYDEAVKQFDEGLAADPEQVVLYSRKSLALRARGVDHYNAFAKSTDDTLKTTELESAKKDFQASAEAAAKGVEIAKKEGPATDASGQAAQASRKLEILANRAESMRLLVKVDHSQLDNAVAAYQEYMAAEPNATSKAKAQHDLAQMIFDAASDAGGFERAVTEYQKILDASPDDLVALLRIGQALFNIGAYNNNDKAKYQEAANYLKRFVDKAPDSNPLKADAKGILDAMKDQANVTPEKTTTTAPTRRRRP